MKMLFWAKIIIGVGHILKEKSVRYSHADETLRFHIKIILKSSDVGCYWTRHLCLFSSWIAITSDRANRLRR
jgi:hypothetical protein